MAEYIEREDALKAVCDACDVISDTERDLCQYKFTGCKEYYNIFELPDADVAPVIHGKWRHETDDDWRGTICSVCRYGFSDGAYHEVSEFNFCPNCGAKMEVQQ